MESNDRIERDRLLRRAVLGGDGRAWRVWYEESFDELYAYVLWRCGGRREQADEVVQEAWLAAVRRLRKFDPARASFPVWMRGIATNVLRSQLRKKMSRDRRHEPADVEKLADGPGDSRERELRGKQRSSRIARTLSRLPEHYDAVLRAKYMDDLSVAQIAILNGDTPKAVESLLGRARRLFREVYQTDGKET